MSPAQIDNYRLKDMSLLNQSTNFKEKPNINGIAVPGMPLGSQGWKCILTNRTLMIMRTTKYFHLVKLAKQNI